MVRFKMFKISVPQFAILSENCENTYNIETTTELKNAIDGSAVAVTMNFSFIGKSGEKAMLLQVTCEFGIHPDDLKSIISDNKVIIPKAVLEHFLVHTVGTARGILHCKTEGTPFNSIILPPMNVTNIIKSDMIINLNDQSV